MLESLASSEGSRIIYLFFDAEPSFWNLNPDGKWLEMYQEIESFLQIWNERGSCQMNVKWMLNDQFFIMMNMMMMMMTNT